MWILLWYVAIASGGGAASAEFNTREACETAKAVVVKQGYFVKADCVPKG
jgi:hypothetical protein